MKTTDIKIYSSLILMLLFSIAAFQTNEVLYEQLFVSLSIFSGLKFIQVTDSQSTIAVNLIEQSKNKS